MNKMTKLALAGVPLVLAYPVAAWVIGQQVESAIGQNYQLLNENPSVKIVERNYERGIFRSTETLTLELFPTVTQAIARQQQEAMAANPGMKLPPVPPMRVSIRSQIKHGPLPGTNGVAAAIADSELVLDGAVRQQLETVFGDNKPLEVHSEYRFDGGGTSRLSSPAFSTHWPAAQGAGNNLLNWGGLTVNIDFEKGLRRYTLQGEAPRLELKDPQGGQMTMTDMRAEGTQQRLFEDDPLLYAGKQTMTLARLVASNGKEGAPALEMKRVKFESDIPVNGDFIDIVGRLGTQSLRIADKDYGPAHYDFSLRHVHARTFATLYREFLKVSADVELQMAAQAEPARLLAPLAKPAMELLKHSPELAIDRLSFRSPHGDASVALRVKFKDLQPQDVSNPMMLLAKLDAGAEISVPEAFLNDAAGSLPGGAPAVPAPDVPGADTGAAAEAIDAEAAASAAAQARSEQMQQRLAELTAQGFVVREGGILKSKLAFSNGQMTVNGQPFNPMAAAAPPAVQQ